MTRALPLLLFLALACKDDGPSPLDSEVGGDDSAQPVDADGDGVPADEDCDDADPGRYPGATEACDGLDNDCDGEADEGVGTAWYADADADGWGDEARAVTACEAPEGHVAQAGDCDDADPAYNPGAPEEDCADPNDYNCDGSVGWADADGDGWPACQDCDDGLAAVNPDAIEVCNDLDDDCDGAVDDEDEGLDRTTALTRHADADGDGYGDPEAAVTACDPPEGHVEDASDCDDDDAFAFPGAAPNDDPAACMADHDGDDWGEAAPEDGVAAGTDCDDGAATTHPGASETWYDGVDADCDGADDFDADGDGHVSDAHGGDDCDDLDAAVNPGASEAWYDGVDADCDGADDFDADGDGFVSDAFGGDDCDDAEASVYPGADEDGGAGTQVGDGLDNDCDGYLDEGLRYGAGLDGALSLSADASLDDHGGACTPVSALSGASATVADASAFATGDKALLIHLQGDAGGAATPGAWELLDVASVSGSAVTFVEPLTGTYGATSNADLSGQAVALLRVPQFTRVSVGSGATLSAGAWDGGCGGVLAFVASSSVTVDGALSMDGAGYAGGPRNRTHDSTGEQGESTAGTGGKANARNLGGGGGGGNAGSSCGNCEGTGGGGAHGADGAQGEQSNPTLGDGGEGGLAYGDATLARLTLGSGGGAGALDGSVEQGIGGAGGAGGGVVLVATPTLSVGGAVTARGEDGEVGCAEFSDWCGTANSGGHPSEAEPGGGGAGGALRLIADQMSISGALDATGGSGTLSGSSWQRTSGDGGVGLIRLDFNALNGQSAGSAAATSEAEAVCEPDPGTLGTP